MRRSVAFWRTRPEAKSFGSSSAVGELVPLLLLLREERRWDSEMRRRSSRSWASREGASSGRVEEDVVFCVVSVDLDFAVWSGGREDYRRLLVFYLDRVRRGEKEVYHEGFEFSF